MTTFLSAFFFAAAIYCFVLKRNRNDWKKEPGKKFVENRIEYEDKEPFSNKFDPPTESNFNTNGRRQSRFDD